MCTYIPIQFSIYTLHSPEVKRCNLTLTHFKNGREKSCNPILYVIQKMKCSLQTIRAKFNNNAAEMLAYTVDMCDDLTSILKGE